MKGAASLGSSSTNSYTGVHTWFTTHRHVAIQTPKTPPTPLEVPSCLSTSGSCLLPSRFGLKLFRRLLQSLLAGHRSPLWSEPSSLQKPLTILTSGEGSYRIEDVRSTNV